MKTELRRFSGYRIKFSEKNKQAWHWGNLRKTVQQLVPFFELAMQEPFFIDDALKQLAPLDLIMYALRDGEIFACIADDQLVGICSFREIKPGRSAIYDAWAVPEFRAPEHRDKIFQLANEVMEYAFRDFPDGLGLVKVKADIAVGNVPAIVTAQNLGFVPVGMSPLDAFHNGEVHDSLLLELLNPSYFGSAVEVIKSDVIRRGIEQDASGAAIHTDDGSSELRSATGPAGGSTASDEREAGDPERELPGGLHDDGEERQGRRTRSGARKSATGQRSAKPRGRGSLRNLLLPESD